MTNTLKSETRHATATGKEIQIPDSAASERNSKQLAPPTKHGGDSRGRILLAEDDDDMRCLLVETLRKEGFEIVACRHGGELLDHLSPFLFLEAPEHFDLIISDIRMPGISGLSIFEAVHECSNLPPMILTTAFGDTETRKQASSLGVASFFDKPFALPEFVRRVHELCKRSENSIRKTNNRRETTMVNASLTEEQVHQFLPMLHAEELEDLQQMADHISHHLKAILDTIVERAEMALPQLGKGTEELNNVQVMRVLAGLALQTLEKLEDFGSVGESTSTRVNLSEVVEEVAFLQTGFLPSYIELTSDVIKPVFAFVDRGQMHELIMELCTNAAEAMFESGGSIDLELKLVGSDEVSRRVQYKVAKTEHAKVSVRDSGPGIQTWALKYIFRPFFTTKHHSPNPGLGLSRIYGIVRKHGGHIVAESKSGGGSTFEVYLPITKSQET